MTAWKSGDMALIVAAKSIIRHRVADVQIEHCLTDDGVPTAVFNSDKVGVVYSVTMLPCGTYVALNSQGVGVARGKELRAVLGVITGTLEGVDGRPQTERQ